MNSISCWRGWRLTSWWWGKGKETPPKTQWSHLTQLLVSQIAYLRFVWWNVSQWMIWGHYVLCLVEHIVYLMPLSNRLNMCTPVTSDQALFFMLLVQYCSSAGILWACCHLKWGWVQHRGNHKLWLRRLSSTALESNITATSLSPTSVIPHVELELVGSVRTPENVTLLLILDG